MELLLEAAGPRMPTLSIRNTPRHTGNTPVINDDLPNDGTVFPL